VYVCMCVCVYVCMCVCEVAHLVGLEVPIQFYIHQAKQTGQHCLRRRATAEHTQDGSQHESSRGLHHLCVCVSVCVCVCVCVC
jgi:hypothetical protein